MRGRRAWRCELAGLGRRVGFSRRISVGVYDALNPVITGSAGEELPFVIEIVI
jgi:hypothetical protein